MRENYSYVNLWDGRFLSSHFGEGNNYGRRGKRREEVERKGRKQGRREYVRLNMRRERDIVDYYEGR